MNSTQLDIWRLLLAAFSATVENHYTSRVRFNQPASSNTKRKSKFTEELQQKYPFFRKGRDEFEAECITCGYETFVSIVNKGKLSLDMHVDSSKHKKAVRFTFCCSLA